MRPPKHPVFLTGYSDASWRNLGEPEGGGGWGVWVRDGRARVFRSGPCPEWVEKVDQAELCGVFAAIDTAVKYLNHETAHILVVKSDSQTVCRWFGWDGGAYQPKAPVPEVDSLVYRSFKAAHEKGLRLSVTWVKGHQRSGTVQGYINNEVDAMAREARVTRKSWVKRKMIAR